MQNLLGQLALAPVILDTGFKLARAAKEVVEAVQVNSDPSKTGAEKEKEAVEAFVSSYNVLAGALPFGEKAHKWVKEEAAQPVIKLTYSFCKTFIWDQGGK